jgi:hypothetical protein
MSACVAPSSLQIQLLLGFYVRNIPEQPRSHLHCGGSLISRACPCLVQVKESRWTEPHPRSPAKCPKTDTKIRNPAQCEAHGLHTYRLNVHTNCTSTVSLRIAARNTSCDFSSLRRGSAAACLLELRVRIPLGECMYLLSIMSCQGEVSASGRSLVQSSPTVCVCVTAFDLVQQ